MAFRFEQLDEVTRRWMLEEFEGEQRTGAAYVGRSFSQLGRSAFPDLIRSAIRSGTEGTLAIALANPLYWSDSEPYERNGVLRIRKINVQQASERLAATEFNTWYVRGLTRRAIEDGVGQCQVYRAADPKWEPAECSAHEGAVYDVRAVYEGHRARYWPEPGDPAALSIPFGPGCHHTIRLHVEVTVEPTK